MRAADTSSQAALAVLGRVLSPALAPHGFGPASAGTSPDGTGQLLFCAPTAQLAPGRPWLPTGFDGPAPPGACVDVMVDVDAGTVSAVRVETGQLGALLELLGHDRHGGRGARQHRPASAHGRPGARPGAAGAVRTGCGTARFAGGRSRRLGVPGHHVGDSRLVGGFPPSAL